MNSAASEWSPAGRVMVVVAVSSVRLTGSPRGVLVSVNCTVPVAVGGVILAVNVSVVIKSADEPGVTCRVVVVGVGCVASAALTG